MYIYVSSYLLFFHSLKSLLILYLNVLTIFCVILMIVKLEKLFDINLTRTSIKRSSKINKTSTCLAPSIS